MPEKPSHLETARRLAFYAESIAREIEATRPDLGKMDRREIARRVMDEILKRPKPSTQGMPPA